MISFTHSGLLRGSKLHSARLQRIDRCGFHHPSGRTWQGNPTPHLASQASIHCASVSDALGCWTHESQHSTSALGGHGLMALSSQSQAPSWTEGQPSILYAIPSPCTSAHQTAKGTMYPVFRMRPRTAKGNFVITRAGAKLTENRPVGTALPVCPITSPSQTCTRQATRRSKALGW